ncbi:MAG: DUF368 domain-containing protein [Clostridia bacterium]|nr:DUF368 domain-containing protein [Clostridia bacterium]
MKTETKGTLLRRVLTGFFIGVAAIAPGISGGAIAIAFGLYEPIAQAVAHIFRDFRKHLLFLAPLGAGAVVGVLLSGRVIHRLVGEYPVFTSALFVGLILGTLPSVFSAAARDGFHPRYLLATALLAVLTGWFTTLDQLQYTGTAGELPLWLTVVCGGILGLGTILPGVSASFVLMALGVYEPLLQVLEQMDILRISLLALGFGGVMLLLARLISWLFQKAHGWMSFSVAGMLIGSLVPAIPIPTADWRGVWMVALAAAGGALSYSLLKMYKKSE